ncbi:MAG: TSUP family transporter [Phycisphaerae bacterium]|nr:TSUP family transporter [Phycisphaerae bacterium]
MVPLAWSLIPPDVQNVAAFLLLGGLSAMLVSVAKAGFGGTIGVLSFPIMVYAYGGDAMLAAGTILPLLVATDLVALAGWWGKWNARAAWMMLPGALAGIGAGAAVLWGLQRLDSRAYAAQAGGTANAALMLIVGLISVSFVLLQAIMTLRGRRLVFRPVPWEGAVAGATAGVASTLAHAAGPVAAMYLLPQQMPKGTYVATTVLFFAVVNQVKLIPYLALGRINATTVGAAVLLLPAVVTGAVLGLMLHGRVPQRQFTAVVYVLLALTGGHMIYKGLATLLG